MAAQSVPAPAGPGCRIGIEIGGTKLQAVLGDESGRVRHRERRSVQPQAGAAAILTVLPALLDDVLAGGGAAWRDVAAIGIGFGGPVDAAAGVVLNSFQVAGWQGFALAAWARETWRRPVALANDAAAAGLAEARLGAGNGAHRVFYLTVGSGIGGGWIVDGRIDYGQGLGMAEIGHTYVPDPQSDEAVELESVCSGWAIARRAQRAAGVAGGEASRLGKGAGGTAAIDAPAVYAAAAAGDRLAARILDETTATLGLALANVIALFHPEVIVLGGGVSLMGPLFWEGLRRQVARRALAPFAGSVRLERAALGEDVVPVGALCLAG